MKPNRERLKELKYKLIKYMNVCNYALETGEDKLILDLIDAALAEPSDADVAEAIKVMTEMLLFMDGTIPADAMSNYGDERQVYETALTALRQYQKPTDEAVHSAIRDIMDIICECKSLFESDKASLYLAIAALRQMRPEQPCEWCKHDEYVQKLMDEMQSNKVYCPNCGRKLVG